MFEMTNNIEDRIAHLNKVLGMSSPSSQAYHLASRELRGIYRTINFYSQQWENSDSITFQMTVAHLEDYSRGVRNG